MRTTLHSEPIILTESDLAAMPTKGFAHYRFLDLGQYDGMVTISSVRVPKGWHSVGTTICRWPAEIEPGLIPDC